MRPTTTLTTKMTQSVQLRSKPMSTNHNLKMLPLVCIMSIIMGAGLCLIFSAALERQQIDCQEGCYAHFSKQLD